jgi:hypothetical protein
MTHLPEILLVARAEADRQRSARARPADRTRSISFPTWVNYLLPAKPGSRNLEAKTHAA